MFLSSKITQILIVVGAILLFIVTFLLNKRTKAPKGVDVPEKCHSCHSPSCIVKMNDLKKLKEELLNEIENCEEEKHETT